MGAGGGVGCEGDIVQGFEARAHGARDVVGSGCHGEKCRRVQEATGRGQDLQVQPA